MAWTYTKRTLFYLLVIGIVVESVFPFYYAILTSFKSEGDAINISTFFETPWTIASYFEVQSRSDYFHHFFNSVIISIGSTVLALVIAVPAAWCSTRTRA